MSFIERKFALDISRKAFTDVEVGDKAAISQSIESILLTSPGERVFFPSFGSPLNKEIFKNIDSERGEVILTKIINLIKKWEKRIYIDEDKCTMSISLENHTLFLNIIYYVIADGTSGQFNKKIIF
jgi:phage baseplate assembly protein W